MREGLIHSRFVHGGGQLGSGWNGFVAALYGTLWHQHRWTRASEAIGASVGTSHRAVAAYTAFASSGTIVRQRFITVILITGRLCSTSPLHASHKYSD
jgi:hypothetical protein